MPQQRWLPCRVRSRLQRLLGGKKELRQLARQVRESRLPPKPKPDVETPSDGASADQLEIYHLKVLLAALTEERDLLKKKVQNLTIALAESRSEQ